MNNQDNKIPWWQPGIIIFAKVSAFVAFPIIIALFLGEYLDKKFDTTPWIFLGLTFIAFMISLRLIWRGMKKYLDKIEKNIKETK